jgi:hypothetical protein
VSLVHDELHGIERWEFLNVVIYVPHHPTVDNGRVKLAAQCGKC